MNLALYSSALRQLATQPVRLGALLGALILPLLQVYVDSDPLLKETWWSTFYAVIATAGVIGLEISSGSVAIFFTRPISRATYVRSRIFAALTLAVGATLLGLFLETLIVEQRGAELSAQAVAFAAGERLLLVGGVTIVLGALSTIVPSLGDLLIWGGINVVGASLAAAGEAASMARLSDAGALLQRIVRPDVALDRIFMSSYLPWSVVTAYAATITLALAVAVLAANRKELSYASE